MMSKEEKEDLKRTIRIIHDEVFKEGYRKGYSNGYADGSKNDIYNDNPDSED